jgi:subtilisin-like proprotein convertase family protein
MALVAMAGMASATLITETFNPTENTANEIAVPDGSPVGIANSLTVSGSGGGAIEDVSVNLDITGGYNGDLYGYLVFQPTGGGAATMDVLLNQIGTGAGNPFGSAGAGFNNITLSDSGVSSIHGATGVPTGTWKPDDGGQTLDATFVTGQAADGTWTLFLADLSSGGGTSELVSWGVNISVVPEPVTWALAGFAGVLVLARFVAWRNQRARAA